jgi:hypothetical protein
MDPRYFEDWKVGDRIETLGRTVGDSEISQFVALGGFFEELFISEEYVKKGSLYPKRFAPGAHLLVHRGADNPQWMYPWRRTRARIGRQYDVQTAAVRRRHDEGSG